MSKGEERSLPYSPLTGTPRLSLRGAKRRGNLDVTISECSRKYTVSGLNALPADPSPAAQDEICPILPVASWTYFVFDFRERGMGFSISGRAEVMGWQRSCFS